MNEEELTFREAGEFCMVAGYNLMTLGGTLTGIADGDGNVDPFVRNMAPSVARQAHRQLSAAIAKLTEESRDVKGVTNEVKR